MFNFTAITRLAYCCLAVVVAFGSSADPGEWSGFIAGELNMFPESPADTRQHGNNLSLAIQPQYYRQWDDSRQSLSFQPFLRLDQHDSERTHADIRELYWEKVAERWELRVGINTVFWGVTESQHLVDIINQTDMVEDVAGEEKLGQPMVNLALVRPWGTIDLFLLPGFRERTFPGTDGRLRPSIPVDTDRPKFESGAKQGHIDWAVRWSHAFGAWDIGLSHFQGTSREPRFVPRIDALRLKLVPYYDQIDQTGLDVQYTKGAWLWKLEAIARSGQDESFGAVTGGFEYTMYGVFDGDLDIGLLAEYLYDSRGENQQSPFEDDIFLGMRIALNDRQNTDLLVGGIFDLETGGTFLGVEASRRIRQNMKLSVKARLFARFSDDDPANSFERDDHLKIELSWFF